MIAVVTLLGGSRAQVLVTEGVDGVDHCSGDTSDGTVDLSTGWTIRSVMNTQPNCFEFTNGITDDPWVVDPPDDIDTCTQAISTDDKTQYAYRTISSESTGVDINSLILISGWRHAYPDLDADDTYPTISVSFTDQVWDWRNEFTAYISNWVDLGRDNLTKLLDIQDYGFTGAKYLVIRYDCPTQTCKKVKIHQVSCFSEYLVDSELLRDYDTEDWTKQSRDLMLRQGDFTINCANLYQLQQGSSRECRSFSTTNYSRFRFHVDGSVDNLSIDNIVAFGVITGVNYDATGIDQVGISDNSYETARLKIEVRDDSSGQWVTQGSWDQTFPDHYPYIMIKTLDTTTSAVSLNSPDVQLNFKSVGGMDRWFVGSFMLTSYHQSTSCSHYLTVPANVPALTLAATVLYPQAGLLDSTVTSAIYGSDIQPNCGDLYYVAATENGVDVTNYTTYDIDGIPTGIDIAIESAQTTAMTIYVAVFSAWDDDSLGHYEIQVAEVIDCLDRYFDPAPTDQTISAVAGVSQDLSIATIIKQGVTWANTGVCGDLQVTLYDENGNAQNITEVNGYDNLPGSFNYEFDATQLTSDTDLDYTIIWGFAYIAEYKFQNIKISVTSCAPYLQTQSLSTTSFQIFKGAQASSASIVPALLSGDYYDYTDFGSCQGLTPILEGDNVPVTVALETDHASGLYTGTRFTFTPADTGVTAGNYTVQLAWYFMSHEHQKVSSANIEIQIIDCEQYFDTTATQSNQSIRTGTEDTFVLTTMIEDWVIQMTTNYSTECGQVDVSMSSDPAFANNEIYIEPSRTNGDYLVEYVNLAVNATNVSDPNITVVLSWSFSAYTSATAFTQTFTIDVIDCDAYLTWNELTPNTLTVPKGGSAQEFIVSPTLLVDPTSNSFHSLCGTLSVSSVWDEDLEEFSAFVTSDFYTGASGLYEGTVFTVSPEDVAVATVGKHKMYIGWQFLDTNGAKIAESWSGIEIIVIDCEEEYFDLTMTTQADQSVQTGAKIDTILPTIIKSATLADPTNNYDAACGKVVLEYLSNTITQGIAVWKNYNSVDNNLIDSVRLEVDTAEGEANLAEGTYDVSLLWSFSVTPNKITTQTFNVVSVDCQKYLNSEIQDVYFATRSGAPTLDVHINWDIMLVDQKMPGDFHEDCGVIGVEISNHLELVTSATLTFDDLGKYNSTKLTINPSSEYVNVDTYERTLIWAFTDQRFYDVSRKEQKVSIQVIDCTLFLDKTRSAATGMTIAIGNQKTFSLPGILNDAVQSGEETNFDSSCAVSANLSDVNGDLIPETLASLTDGQFYDQAGNVVPVVREVTLDVNSVGAAVQTIEAKLVWTFSTSTDVIHEMPFTVDVISCLDYLQVPLALQPSSSSFEIGANVQEIEIFPTLLASNLYNATSFDTDCGVLQVSLLNIDRPIASVSLIEEELTGVYLGTRMTVNPLASGIQAGIFPIRLVWGFSGESTAFVEANYEITFITLVDCLEAQISFPGSENFQTEQTIYVGDWSTTQEDSVEADVADTSTGGEASASENASEESNTSTETTNEVVTATESNAEALDQEEKIVIPWPAYSADLPQNCDAEIVTTVVFLGEGSIGESWRTVDTDQNEITVNTKDPALEALKTDVLVLVTIKSAVVDSENQAEILTAELSLALRLQAPAQKIEAAEPEEDIQSVEEDEEDEEDATTDNTTVEDADDSEVNSFQFAGVVVDEEPEQERVQTVVVKPDPIKATVEFASKEGTIKIKFSRAVRLNLDGPDDDTSSDQESSEERRMLQDTYSEEDKVKLAGLLEVEYHSQTEEGQEKSEIVGIEVVTATDTLLELKLTHSNPAVVSNQAGDQDTVTIKFDKSIFNDPEFEGLEINDGKPLEVSLPRQIDPATAEVIASTMEAANSATNTILTGNVFINILLGSSLKLLWGMINTLQFVVFFTDWEVQIPPTTEEVIKAFRKIALGEFIPWNWLTDPLTELFESSEGIDEQQSEGEDGEQVLSQSILGNMGIMLLFFAVIIVVVILIAICVKLCKPGSKLHNGFLKIKGKIYWNAILRFILQGYLKISIGTLFSLSVLSVSTNMEAVNCGIAILVFLALLVLPVFFYKLLRRNQENLDTDAMRAKIGSIYLGIRTSTTAQLLYSSVFLSRRMLYAILTMACINNPNILIHVFLITNILYTVYLGLSNPNDTPLGRRMEFMNEIGLQLITYHLALFPLSPNSDDEALAGYSMIAAIGLVFVSNLVIMVCLSISGVKRKCYLRKLKKRQETQIRQVKQKNEQMAKMLEVVRESNRAAVRRASINQAKPVPAPDARKNRRKAPISVLNALEQLIEQPKPNADVRGLDESSRLPENSVSEMELVVSDASFGADDQQLSVVDELPDKEDNCSSRLNERMNKAKQYIEEEIKTVDIDFTPELARPSPAAAPKLLPQKPISSDPKQQLEVIDEMLREIEDDYMSASAGNGRDSDSVMMSTMKRQPWVSDGFN